MYIYIYVYVYVVRVSTVYIVVCLRAGIKGQLRETSVIHTYRIESINHVRSMHGLSHALQLLREREKERGGGGGREELPVQGFSSLP